ncbi:MAG: FUSC family protein [Proteobacteria bacterium]|nr:FUSC family protein [Pseudomonadota bacterium]
MNNINIKASRLTYYFSLPRVINCFKTALACVVGYLIYLFTPLPQAQWIIITVLVVMSAQTTVGGIFIKAQMRLLGTIFGAAVAILIIFLCKNQNTELIIGIGLFVSIMSFTYIASRAGDISYVGTLGSVTVAIILLNKEISLSMAGERFFEIVFGILLSFLVSYFVFPIRSHNLFINNLADTINHLRDYFERCFHQSMKTHSSFFDEDEKILGIFVQQKRLIYETGLEFGKARTDKTVFKRIFNIERRIYRAINMILYSIRGIEETVADTYFENFQKNISGCFSDLSALVKSGMIKSSDIEMKLAALEQAVLEKMQQLDLKDEYQYSLIFSLKFLINELKNLNSTIPQIKYGSFSKSRLLR